jgi:hypothetical protein
MKANAPIKSSLPKLRRTNEYTGAQFATILYYGLARMGKTHILRTLAGTGLRVLIIATEPGKMKGLGTLNQQDFSVVPCENWDDVDAVLHELTRVPGICQYAGEEFDTIVVDSLSYMGDMWFHLALKVLGWKEVGLPAQGSGRDGRRPYIYIAEKGRQTVLRFINDVPAHIICVCREGTMSDKTDQGDDEIVPAPEFPGQQLSREIPGLLDASLRMRKINGKAVFCTQTEYKAVSGIRINFPNGVTIPKYIKPDLGALIRLMKGDVSAIQALTPDPISPKKAAQQQKA